MTALYWGIDDDYTILPYASQHQHDHVIPGMRNSPSMLTSLSLGLMRHWQDSSSFDWPGFLDPDLFYDYERDS